MSQMGKYGELDKSSCSRDNEKQFGSALSQKDFLRDWVQKVKKVGESEMTSHALGPKKLKKWMMYTEM